MGGPYSLWFDVATETLTFATVLLVRRSSPFFIHRHDPTPPRLLIDPKGNRFFFAH
jgi:hypothetical protein